METMEKLADKALQSASAQPTASTLDRQIPDEAFRRLVPLWEHMTGIYGHKWVTTYGAEVSETWVRGLRDVGPEGLIRGLRRCLDWNENDGWPPTLPQFRALCEPEPVRSYFKGLPAPKLSPEQLAVIEADIKVLRKLLKHHRREFERELRERRYMPRIREPGDDDEQPEAAA